MTALFARSYAIGTEQEPLTVYRVSGFEGELSDAVLEPVSIIVSVSPHAETHPPRGHVPLVHDVLWLPGMAACVLTPWVASVSVQLRQELMLGMCEFEQAGYYAKEALAALVGDRAPSSSLVALEGRSDVHVFFGPMPEVEALRQAACRHLWTEMNNARSWDAMQADLRRYVPLAELEDECVHIAAGLLALGRSNEAMAFLDWESEEASEFEPLHKRAELLADVLRGRVRFAMQRDGN